MATSSEVKMRYNQKTYKSWVASLRKEDFAVIDALREETALSKTEFLKMLVKKVYPNAELSISQPKIKK